MQKPESERIQGASQTGKVQGVSNANQESAVVRIKNSISEYCQAIYSYATSSYKYLKENINLFLTKIGFSEEETKTRKILAFLLLLPAILIVFAVKGSEIFQEKLNGFLTKIGFDENNWKKKAATILISSALIAPAILFILSKIIQKVAENIENRHQEKTKKQEGDQEKKSNKEVDLNQSAELQKQQQEINKKQQEADHQIKFVKNQFDQQAERKEELWNQLNAAMDKSKRGRSNSMSESFHSSEKDKPIENQFGDMTKQIKKEAEIKRKGEIALKILAGRQETMQNVAQQYDIYNKTGQKVPVTGCKNLPKSKQQTEENNKVKTFNFHGVNTFCKTNKQTKTNIKK